MRKIALLVIVLTALAVTAADAGTIRYYNSRGSATGSSTTTKSGMTTYYNARGHVTGHSYRSR